MSAVRYALLGDTLANPLSGIGWYTVRLAEAMAPMMPAGQWTLVRPSSDEFHHPAVPTTTTRMVHLPLRPVRRMVWEQGAAHRALRRLRPKLVHGPGLMRWLARKPPKGAKVVQTIHDLTPMTHPQTHKLRTRMEFEVVLRRAFPRLDGVATVSQESLARIRDHFPGVDDIPHRVIHNGVDNAFFEARPTPSAQPYFLCVGNLEPRKNLATAFEAYRRYRAMGGKAQLKVVGPAGWKQASTLEALQALGPGEVDFAGFVARDELPGLYAGAMALVFPSLYEGFGLPVVEAMAASCPVICSEAGALREVAGGAAATFGALDADGMALAMRRMDDDRPWRQAWIRKGTARAAGFSWRKTAADTLQLYHEVLGE